jgi:hypothetical protein|tara:strand:+ start:444 stop:818 length:375 start_codon:yes stop_codon:yes gene_type:complete
MKPFDLINSITYKKDIVMNNSNEGSYNPFITNRSLSQFIDCILLANEMNQRHHIDNKLQYDYLINRIRPRKRFKKWDKKQDNENIQLIKDYYSCNNDKARVTLSLLSEQHLNIIRQKLNKGGVK